MACPVYARGFALALRQEMKCSAEPGFIRASNAPKFYLFSAYRPRNLHITARRRIPEGAGNETFADPFANDDVRLGTHSDHNMETSVERRRAGPPSETPAQHNTSAHGGRRRPYGTSFGREQESGKQSSSSFPSRPFRERATYQSQDSRPSRSREPPTRDTTDPRTQDFSSEQHKLALRKQQQEAEASIWRTQRHALKSKFPTGWSPPKRLSPEALEGIRALNAQYPEQFTTPILASHFKVSPESIRRILKSKWRPSGEEDEERRERWERRGESVWRKWVEEGKHAPKKWRMRGIGTGPRREGQDRSLQRRLREGGGGGPGVPWG